MDIMPRINKKIISVTSLNNIEEEKNYWLSKKNRLNELKLSK